MKILSGIAVVLLCCSLGSKPVQASFHLMQVEQVIGGVNGDSTAQAVQLRMRSALQSQVSGARIRAWDAAGANPIMVVDMTTSVPTATQGSRILIASTGFIAYTEPNAIPDFPITNPIPASYLPAGSLTFESDAGLIYWRLSWGGSNYTGPTTGLTDNDVDGQFGPPFAGLLPSSTLQALRFTGAANAKSTNNAANYAITTGAATFNNNAGTSFVVTLPPLPGDFDGDVDVDLDDLALLVDCIDGPEDVNPPVGCDDQVFDAGDFDADSDLDLRDVYEFLTFFGQ